MFIVWIGNKSGVFPAWYKEHYYAADSLVLTFCKHRILEKQMHIVQKYKKDILISVNREVRFSFIM